MSTWRAKVSAFFRTWRRARDEVKQTKDARRDEQQAEELQMARDGAMNRFPPMGG